VRLTANIKEMQDDQEGDSDFLANLSGQKMTAVKANKIAREYLKLFDITSRALK